jgi:hypothetical protein
MTRNTRQSALSAKKQFTSRKDGCIMSDIVKGKILVEYNCPEKGTECRVEVTGKDFYITELASHYEGTIDFRCTICGQIHTIEINE